MNPESTVIRVLTEQLGCSSEDLTRETKLRDDLGVDSLDEVEIIMALEDEFNTEIEDEEAEKLLNGPGADCTIGALIDFVAAKAGARA